MCASGTIREYRGEQSRGDMKMWPCGRAAGGGGAGRRGQGSFGCRWPLFQEKWPWWQGALSRRGLAQGSRPPGPAAARGTRGCVVGAALAEPGRGGRPPRNLLLSLVMCPAPLPSFRVFWSILLLLCLLLAVLSAVTAMVGSGAGWLRPLRRADPEPTVIPLTQAPAKVFPFPVLSACRRGGAGARGPGCPFTPL